MENASGVVGIDTPTHLRSLLGVHDSSEELSFVLDPSPLDAPHGPAHVVRQYGGDDTNGHGGGRRHGGADAPIPAEPARRRAFSLGLDCRDISNLGRNGAEESSPQPEGGATAAPLGLDFGDGDGGWGGTGELILGRAENAVEELDRSGGGKHARSAVSG